MMRLTWQSMIALAVVFLTSHPANSQTIGSAMVSFAQGRVGTRVGGGECAHLATEALRVNGGEFVPGDLGADSPGTGDYVWGTLVTVISYANKTWSDSNPTNACLPGDVIQYGGSAIMAGARFPSRHTSVVTTVDQPTFALQCCQ